MPFSGPGLHAHPTAGSANPGESPRLLFAPWLPLTTILVHLAGTCAVRLPFIAFGGQNITPCNLSSPFCIVAHAVGSGNITPPFCQNPVHIPTAFHGYFFRNTILLRNIRPFHCSCSCRNILASSFRVAAAVPCRHMAPTLLACLLAAGSALAAAPAAPYTPTWPSLDSRATPDWWREAVAWDRAFLCQFGGCAR